MTHVTCSLTAKNRDQPRNPTLGNQAWATFFTNWLNTAAYTQSDPQRAAPTGAWVKSAVYVFVRCAGWLYDVSESYDNSIMGDLYFFIYTLSSPHC